MRRHRRAIVPSIVLALLVALGVALILRAKAPPEAARLLPESDAIFFVHLKPLRAATHFDQTPVTRSADFQHFIDATGIVPERDLDSVAFALHRMPDPRGPNGPIAYSEVFVGTFDGAKLTNYLTSIASSRENYAGHSIFLIPIEGRTLRVTQLGYDTVAASNMPTAEQIHSMIDRFRASALSSPGSSLLAARYREVPLLSPAWGIGHIGLPLAQNGRIALFGLELPLPEDTDLVASLRFSTGAHLRIEELAPTPEAAAATTDALNTLLNITRGLSTAAPLTDSSANAMREILASATAEQKDSRAILSASATFEQLKALTTAHNPTTADTLTQPTH